MAKKINNPVPVSDDLNAEGIAPEMGASADLNAEGIVPEMGASADKLNASVGAGERDDVDVIMDDEPEFVVLKGNSIRHNGEVYRENSTIPVVGQDAERLLQAGIIADVRELRQHALASQSSVTVTAG
ncbi:hypothetical protein [Edwardsiella anguillarum]|uniref:Uncharacterized protein n=1 Tax=Edwardsiella anguillarum TaxID=1821960 RepID=A0ABY8SIA6_9GAMM|nr:hypothetical protein [Edwardsiella anguillarum]WHP85200.1 hypothetical protein MQ095_07210 [Edwardsiella anguillarum]WHP88982.1 hypothetical protein MQ088_07215 [Edwardsiella anguillarum]WHP92782.1 hypothetical protein MQ091_07210 [Edwardsiella anguillarum]WHP96587.1 hypothetical protein MQ096_07205 [Edwardsiella anguillarum]WHQ00457.1 hypothetical protein MQ082_07210 [Edwardsiella anguillarum]